MKNDLSPAPFPNGNMKQKVSNLGCIVILIGILAGCITFIVYMVIRWAKEIWIFLNEPDLSIRLTEMFKSFLQNVGYLGVCVGGIILVVFASGFILTKIPPSWMGLRESNDDDYWYDNM
jgi:hypothetical protein